MVYEYLKTKTFSRDTNIISQMHGISNIFGHSVTTIGIFEVSLNYPILNFKKTVCPKSVWMGHCPPTKYLLETLTSMVKNVIHNLQTNSCLSSWFFVKSIVPCVWFRPLAQSYTVSLLGVVYLIQVRCKHIPSILLRSSFSHLIQKLFHLNLVARNNHVGILSTCSFSGNEVPHKHVIGGTISNRVAGIYSSNFDVW